MNARLLLIDPQNDFCDIQGAALPVLGANQDLKRTADFLERARDHIDELLITFDSHAHVGVERTTFWQEADGTPTPAFTQVAADDVRQGRHVPRDPALRLQVIDYLEKLEQGGRYRLMVWPVHCVLGTWGHNLQADIANQVAQWEERRQRPCIRILKGRNPMTEQYSAVQAEVPLDNDPRTLPNAELVEGTRPGPGLLLVAGEASSHCVAATMRHLLKHMSREERERVVLLTDCMSAVPGFQAQADQFFAEAAAQGVRLLTASQALALLGRH